MKKEQAPSSSLDSIQGIHTNISFGDVEKLQEFLDSSVSYSTLYRSIDRPKDPIEEIRLDYGSDDDNGYNFYASVSFDALATQEAGQGKWQVDAQNYLFKRLPQIKSKAIMLPHQLADFYVALDDNHAVFVEFQAATNECNMAVSLEKIKNIIEAGVDPQSISPQIVGEYSRLETLKAASEILSMSIDAIIERFGDDSIFGENQTQIVIAPPERASFRPASREFEVYDADNQEVIPGVTVPEVEAQTSDNHGFELIGGLTSAVDRLKEIAAVYRDPEGAAMYDISGRHFILHGPAGTGKTSLVHAFAHEIGADVQIINSTDLIDKWVGSSGMNAKRVFGEVSKNEQPVVLFFDEFDSLGKKQASTSDERTDVKKYLNTAIDDITANHSNIVIAAATNADIDDLEPSLVRSGRLESIPAPKPNSEERVDVWAAVLHSSWMHFNKNHEVMFDGHGDEFMETFTPYEDDLNPVELAKLTDDMTGADFKVILERARRKRFLAYQKTGKAGKVCQQDLLHEIKNFGR